MVTEDRLEVIEEGVDGVGLEGIQQVWSRGDTAYVLCGEEFNSFYLPTSVQKMKAW